MTGVDPYRIPSRAVANLRHVGGHPTADGGRVRAGLLYRSAELAAPQVADDEVLAGLGLRTVVDLRTLSETRLAPDVLPAGARGVHLDVLAADPDAPATDLASLLQEPARLSASLAAQPPVEQMLATYVELVVSSPARTGYAALARLLLADDARPVLVHCTAGKDRTGWAVTVLLLVAGVPDDAVRDEYLSVNPAVQEAFAPVISAFAAAGGDAALLEPLLEVRPEYLDAALDAMRTEFGSLAGYLSDGLGLAAAEIVALRAVLREPAAR